MSRADADRRLVRYPAPAPHKDRQQRDRDADKRGPDKEPDETGLLDHEAREPGQNAARKGAERSQQAELTGRMLHRRDRRHIGDQHDRRESVSKSLNADRQRKGPESIAAISAMRGKKREREMRGRARD